MKGWRIFAHSVQLVFNHLPMALKISGIPYLIIVVASVALGNPSLMDPDLAQQAMENGTYPYGQVAILSFISAIVGLWIAVGWHRYVLLDEEANGVPKWHGRRIWSYFVSSLKILLILVPVFIVGILMTTLGAALAAFLVTSLGGANTGAASIIGGGLGVFLGAAIMIALVFAMIAIGYRLSAVLPGFAIDQEHQIGDGWRATSGETGAIMVAALATAVSSFLLELPTQFLLPNIPIAGIIWSLIVGWLYIVIGVSILTTLYGHYVQKRELF